MDILFLKSFRNGREYSTLPQSQYLLNSFCCGPKIWETNVFKLIVLFSHKVFGRDDARCQWENVSDGTTIQTAVKIILGLEMWF